MDYRPADCVAVRNFADGEKTYVLRLRPSPFWDVMELSVLRPGKQGTPDQLPLRLQIDEDPPISSYVLLHGAKSGKVDYRVNRLNIPIETFSRLRRAGQMHFATSTIDVTLKLDLLSKVGEALQKCVEDLQSLWNIGPVYAGRLRQPPMPVKPLASLFSENDYPGVALLNHMSGSTTFVLLIDETGKMASCNTIVTSGIASLDTQVCAILLQRAKFNPAIDTDGKPAKGTISTKVQWISRL